jgi:hypothetical protein
MSPVGGRRRQYQPLVRCDEGEPAGDTGFGRRRLSNRTNSNVAAVACNAGAAMTQIAGARRQQRSPMRCRKFLLAAACSSLLAGGARSQPPAAEGQAAKTYVPGIEQFMNLIQSEHAKLWFAGSAGNWALAAYQLAEIKELMSDVEDLYPTFKNLPLGEMLDAVVTGPIVEVEKALDGKDAAAFAGAYDKLTQACNSCHQATGNGFLVIQRPTGPAFPNQNFAPRR